MMDKLVEYLRALFGPKPKPSQPNVTYIRLAAPEVIIPEPALKPKPQSTASLIESMYPGMTARVGARCAAINKLPPAQRNAMIRQF